MQPSYLRTACMALILEMSAAERVCCYEQILSVDLYFGKKVAKMP